MADNRALMAAFQKVRADVDQALEQTRRKEEAARAAEEAKRAQERREKRQGSAAAKQSGKASAGEANSARESKSEQSMVKAARVTPLQASSSAAKQASARVSENTAVRAPRTYSPKGAFGAVLAGAAQASGAVFRESPALQGESAARRRSPIKPHLQIKPCRTANAKSCIPVLRAPLQRRRMQDIERIVPGEQIGPCKQRQDGRQKLTVVKIVSCGLVVPICPRAVRYELKMDVKTRVLSVEDDRSVQLVRNSPGPNAVIPFRLLNSCRGCRFLNAQPMLSRRLKRIKSSSSAVKRGRVKRRSSRRSA